MVGPGLGIYLCCLDILAQNQGRYRPSQRLSEIFLSYLLYNWYFVCWRFKLVTIGPAHLPLLDRSRDRWKQLMCIPNIKRLTKEDSIFWFDLCGWLLTILRNFWLGLSSNRKPLLGIIDYWHYHQLFLHWILKSWSRTKWENSWYKHPSHQLSHNPTNISKSYCKILKRWNL